MISAEWVPEPFPRSGGLAAAGFAKLLGRPRLDPLAVLLRETAQNSWDARQDDKQAVIFNVEGWDLEPSERASLKDSLFTNASRAKGTGLDAALARSSLTALYISDRNTLGLGGPMQADEANADSIYDWVDFILNVGKANTAGHTGGTYGFGKTISYVVSSVRTIVVYTRTIHNGRPQSRLIGCAIGEEFTLKKRLCTGRHWWGRSVDQIPHPLTGIDADRLAFSIGMPEFESSDLGTTIMIIAPDFGDRTFAEAMTFLAESAAWHLWPKMLKRKSGRPMEISVSFNGEQVKIPSPSERPPLHGFAQAFQALLDGDGAKDEPAGTQHDVLHCQRPLTEIGDLVTVPMVYRERALVHDGHIEGVDDSPEPAAMISGVSHHVALLRTPELVVTYLEGPVPPEGGLEWAGVFRCRSGHDASFAAAEPPTHDAWMPALLPARRDRTVVNVGIREIRRILNGRWAVRPALEDNDATSTALIASDLAGLVRTVEQRGPGRRDSAGGDPPPPSRPNAKVEIVRTGPVVRDGGVMTLVELKVNHRPESAGTRLHVECGAALDGATSDADLDPDLKLIEANVMGSILKLEGFSASIDIHSTEPADVGILTSRGPNTTVLLDVQAEVIPKE